MRTSRRCSPRRRPASSAPLTFSALASEPARSSCSARTDPIPHTDLGQPADLVVVAPATARVDRRVRGRHLRATCSVATLLATRAPVLVCPAMHTEMWEHPAVQENIATSAGVASTVLSRQAGRLAGGDVGAGRLAARPTVIVDAAARSVGSRRREPPARSPDGACSSPPAAPGSRSTPSATSSNRSSGRQGHALADAAAELGAESDARHDHAAPDRPGIEVVEVETAAEMADAVLARADGRRPRRDGRRRRRLPPGSRPPTKLHKSDGPPAIKLVPTLDILAELGATPASRAGARRLRRRDRRRGRAGRPRSSRRRTSI